MGHLSEDDNVIDIQVPCIVFFVMVPPFLLIRFYSRVKTGSGLGWDDWTIMASWVSLFVEVNWLPSEADFSAPKGLRSDRLEPSDSCL